MDAPSREEMDAKIEASETRIDYRLRSLEEKIETRFAQFETRFAQFETRFAQLELRFARFENEILRSMTGLVKWIVGTAIALGAAGITILAFVLNNAVPKSAPVAAPVVIYLTAPNVPAR
ncbi:MAG TPA: hypothetical protein VFG03_09010 [Telluria sp.]|nr:hypothetical protein [Telluria sp.]